MDKIISVTPIMDYFILLQNSDTFTKYNGV